MTYIYTGMGTTTNTLVPATDDIVELQSVCGWVVDGTHLTYVNLPIFYFPFLRYESVFSLLFSGMAATTFIVDWFEHLISTSIFASIFYMWT